MTEGADLEARRAQLVDAILKADAEIERNRTRTEWIVAAPRFLRMVAEQLRLPPDSPLVGIQRVIRRLWARDARKLARRRRHARRGYRPGRS